MTSFTAGTDIGGRAAWSARAALVCFALSAIAVGCSSADGPGSGAGGAGGGTSTGQGGAGGAGGTSERDSGEPASGGRDAGASDVGGPVADAGLVADASGGGGGGGRGGAGGPGTGGGGGGGAGGGGTGGAGGRGGAGGTGTGGAGGAGGTGGGGGAGGAGGGGAGGATHTGVWKVMLLGDSVTGSTCYPQLLSRDLIAARHTNFQLVGSVTNNCGNGAPSVKSEGHGGYGVTYLPSTSTRPRCTKQAQGCGSYAELQSWATARPDIVLMHFATNDCWDGQPTATILAAYLAVIAEFRRQSPNVVFFVSKIIPLTPAPANAIALNAAVTPAWAAANSTAASPIRIIDHWTGFNAATDTADGVHPTPAGAQKMATTSLNALVAAGYF